MANIFDKWNKNINTKELAEQVKEAAKNNQEFDDVPFGEYVVKIEKMELKESKKGDPMFTAWFKVIEGEQKDRLIFMNQLVVQPFQIHIVNEFLRDLDTTVEIDFVDYAQWNDTILDVHEEAESLEFLLNYYETKKGYSAFEIKEVYDA